MNPVIVRPLTISAGQSDTGITNINGEVFVGFRITTPWATAGVSILGVSYASDNTPEASELGPVFNGDGEVNFANTVAMQNHMVAVELADVMHLKYIALRSGTYSTPVTQTVQQTIRVITRLG